MKFNFYVGTYIIEAVLVYKILSAGRTYRAYQICIVGIKYRFKTVGDHVDTVHIYIGRPNIDRCGTPVETLLTSEYIPLNTTYCDLSFRYEFQRGIAKAIVFLFIKKNGAI